MSKVSPISPREEVLDEASLWIARLDRGLSVEEDARLVKWIAQSEGHRLALIKMGQVWDKTEVLRKLANLFPEATEQKSSRIWKTQAIAASVAAFLLSAFLLAPSLLETSLFESSEDVAVSNLESLYRTAIGEHTRVNLPDGTELFLNTNTTVRVNYSSLQRVLILDQGELHVQVAHDEDRPLSVLVGDQVVQAVGTAFNIELNQDRTVDLVVTEGKVLVGQREEMAPSISEPILLPLNSLAISGGERVLLSQIDVEERAAPEFIEPEEIEIQLLWRQGSLIFRGEPLEEAIREISRYTSDEFVFADESLKQVKVAGLFQTGDVDGLLSALGESFEVDSQRIGHRILLTRR